MFINKTFWNNFLFTYTWEIIFKKLGDEPAVYDYATEKKWSWNWRCTCIPWPQPRLPGAGGAPSQTPVAQPRLPCSLPECLPRPPPASGRGCCCLVQGLLFSLEFGYCFRSLLTFALSQDLICLNWYWLFALEFTVSLILCYCLIH